MYTDSQIEELWKKRRSILIPSVTLGIMAMFGYLGLLAVVQAEFDNLNDEWFWPFIVA